MRQMVLRDLGLLSGEEWIAFQAFMAWTGYPFEHIGYFSWSSMHSRTRGLWIKVIRAAILHSKELTNGQDA